MESREEIGQRLARISMEYAAQGILVLRDGQLWAYSGQLNQPAAQEIAQMVANHLPLSKSGDQVRRSELARFIQLGSTGREYMLFATPLSREVVLALIFEADAPFNQIRAQAYQIAHQLASPPGELPGSQIYKQASVTSAIPGMKPPVAGSQAVEGREQAEPPLPVKPLLDQIPPPMPGTRSGAAYGSQAAEQSWNGTQEAVQPDSEAVEKVRGESFGNIPAETRQQSALPVIFDLSYYCLLIPRMPRHQLSGDLAVKLCEWMGQLCLAYGWRLEHLLVQPEYIQWVVNVVPTVAPDEIVEVLRKQTSERIFASFPELKRENPSGDFWAPGYLILTRIESLSEQMIRDFMSQVRQYQGAAPGFPDQMRR